MSHFLRKSMVTTVILAVLVSMVPLAMAQDLENPTHFSVVHDVSDAPLVDVYVGDGDDPAVAGLSYGETSDQVDLEAGTYDVTVVPAGATGPVIASGSLELEAHTVYSVTFSGSVGDMPLELALAVVEGMGDDSMDEGMDEGDSDDDMDETMDEGDADDAMDEGMDEGDADDAMDEGMDEGDADDAMDAEELPNLAVTVMGQEDLSTLVGVVTGAGPAFLGIAGGEDPHTVFAPTNDAFEAVPPPYDGLLAEAGPSATGILFAHLTTGIITLEQLAEMDGEQLTMLWEADDFVLTVKVEEMEGEEAPTIYLVVNGDEENAIQLTGDEYAASNGNVIVIEGVILPPPPEGMGPPGGEGDADMGDDEAAADEEGDADMGDDEAAADEEGDADMGDDEAAADEEGDADMADMGDDEAAADEEGDADMGDDEAAADEEDDADMGDDEAAADEEGDADMADMGDDEAAADLPSLVEIAMGDENFSALVGAAAAADPAVLGLIGGDDPYTIFAPPNEAFDAVPRLVLQNVLRRQAWVTSMLQAHVVAGTLTLEDLAGMDGEELATLNPDVTLTVSVGEDGAISLLVNGDEDDAVQLAGAEAPAANGNVIIIQSVILTPRP